MMRVLIVISTSIKLSSGKKKLMPAKAKRKREIKDRSGHECGGEKMPLKTCTRSVYPKI